MDIKKGIAASPGISIAEAFIIDSEDYRIPKRSIQPSQRITEIQRVRNAFHEAAKELTELETMPQETDTGQIRDIFAVHLRILKDRHLRRRITDKIHAESITAEYAVWSVFRDIASRFTNVKDPYISERAADIHDIEKRVLRQLLARHCEDVHHLSNEVVIIARELSPTQTAGFNRQFVKAIATDAGGRTGHSAIVARSLGIPAVVALEDLSEIVRPGDTIIVDGNHGIVIINPNPDTLSDYQRQLEEFSAMERRLLSIRGKPAQTRDGTQVKLLGNIEFPDEAGSILEKGGDGIGLYRTEFLYLNREDDPCEEEHFEAYVRTIELCRGKPVTIRTVDLGADKYTHRMRLAPEPNPFLGLRSIRYCLQNIRLFRIQLRALLRASARGPIRIMFPLVTHVQELLQAKMILRDVMEDLEEERLTYDKDLQIGIMIETPASALCAANLAQEADFFSIGTNDLIQYTLAVDRSNESVATLYSASEPAVLRLIQTVIHDAYKAQIDISICGEMASEPEYIMLLLGMGMRTLSLSAPMIPEVKQVIRSVTIEECNDVARKVMSMNSGRLISSFLRGNAKELIPETF